MSSCHPTAGRTAPASGLRRSPRRIPCTERDAADIRAAGGEPGALQWRFLHRVAGGAHRQLRPGPSVGMIQTMRASFGYLAGAGAGSAGLPGSVRLPGSTAGCGTSSGTRSGTRTGEPRCADAPRRCFPPVQATTPRGHRRRISRDKPQKFTAVPAPVALLDSPPPTGARLGQRPRAVARAEGEGWVTSCPAKQANAGLSRRKRDCGNPGERRTVTPQLLRGDHLYAVTDPVFRQVASHVGLADHADQPQGP
jgi:hypothetical protein